MGTTKYNPQYKVQGTAYTYAGRRSFSFRVSFYCYYKEALRHITRLYEHFEYKTTAITANQYHRTDV